MPSLSSKLPEGAGRTGRGACLHRGRCMTRLPLAKLGLAPLEMRLGRPCQPWLCPLYACGGRGPWKARLLLLRLPGQGLHPPLGYSPSPAAVLCAPRKRKQPHLWLQRSELRRLPRPFSGLDTQRPHPTPLFLSGPARQGGVPRCSPSHRAEHRCSTPGLSPGLILACTPSSSWKPF